jgi:ATP-dependent Lon protease
MTGEITLRGKVLPVGGIKEKILAAKRAGMKYVILCEENQKNVEQIPAAYLTGMQFHYVERMEEVLDIALRYEKGGKNSNSNSKTKTNSKASSKIKGAVS